MVMFLRYAILDRRVASTGLQLFQQGECVPDRDGTAIETVKGGLAPRLPG